MGVVGSDSSVEEAGAAGEWSELVTPSHWAVIEMGSAAAQAGNDTDDDQEDKENKKDDDDDDE